MITYALDFESYYDDECSITTAGPRGYFSHPSFDAYMVTVVGDDGFVYAGHPKNFNWPMLAGHRVLMHNASFDESLYLYGVEAGWYPKVEFGEVHCTADMCAALGKPRSLKNATAEVFGLEVLKTTRDNMKGKRWESMSEEFRKEVTEYAIKDSELCLRLWQELSDGWSDFERAVSATNRRIGQRGVPMDQNLLHNNLGKIKKALYDAEQAIPWIGEYTPLSRKAFNAQCRKEGITPPVSLAQDSEEADKWFAEHQKACPWARAVQSYRRINAFMRKLESFAAGTMPDGRFYGGFMYFGANPTGRFSGSGGNLNLQNLPRGEMFGVDFRSMIRPKDGYKLIIADLSQIEVRTLCWWAQDKEALEEIRKSPDIYHAFGVLLGLHDPANGPLKEYSSDLRSQVKMLTLGCGFAMGPNGFAAKEGIPLEEAERNVGLYRRRMKKIVKLWSKLDEDCRMAHALEQPLTVTLPSGRTMDYGMLKRMRNRHGYFEYIGKMVRNGARRDFRIWKGLQAENCLAGDTLVLSDSGWKPIVAVTESDKLWDGEEWVSHRGLISNGLQPVIECHGVICTPDHEFLDGGEWKLAQQLACQNLSGKVLLPNGTLKDCGGHTGSSSVERGKRFNSEVPHSLRMADRASRDNSCERREPVYDIRDCGKRSRFVVMGHAGEILIAHNCSQALARDIFADIMVRVEDAGYRIVMHVHDELIVEVAEDAAEKALTDIQRIMATPPEWIPDIPLSSDAHIEDYYSK
jgi:DNA polymerase I-like protein with 3'-5' exonuclease and polymerase domains